MAQPAPLSTRSLLICVTVSLGVSLFFWNTLPVYPFRLLVTLMHESGHALMTVLLGGHVQSMTISPTQGGLTQSVYPASLWRGMLIDSAGYVGSAISGAALLWAAGRIRSGRLLLASLIAWMLAVAIAWVPLIPPRQSGALVEASGYGRGDGLFTLAFIALLSGVFFLIAWKGALWLRQMLLVFIATLSCFFALQDLKRLLGYDVGASDAMSMAQLTHIPAVIWAGLWMLMSLFAVGIGLRSIVLRRLPVRRRAAA
jgi:hypothetical protein